MGLTGRLFFVVLSVILAFSFQAYRRHTKPLPIPKLDLNRYWGPGQAKPDNTKIEKFVIDFKQEVSYFDVIREQLHNFCVDNRIWIR